MGVRDDMNRRPYPRKHVKRALARDQKLGGLPVRGTMPHNPAFFADFHPSGLASFEAVVRFVGEQLTAL